jgi:nuclear pore complex protein Nup188
VAINVNNEKLDPPSLLGQLNAEAGKQFLAVISNLDRPLRDIDAESSIWAFLAAIMGSKQQWFAIYVLTGALPKDRLKASASSTRKSLLGYALDELSTIGDLPPERAVAMLKFVAAAQNTWIWATNEIRAHSDFLKKTVQWLSRLQAPSRAGNMAEEALAASEHAMAASLCSILAVTTHACLEVGDASIALRFRGTLGFLVDDAVGVDSYNRSLHRNLAENFARKFSASECEVAHFKRSSANPAPYGRRFYYDIELAGEVLGHEKAWHGTGNRISDQGFKDEFARANVNLSLFYAQKELLAAWRVLATTLCELVRRYPEHRRQQGGPDIELARTAENLLRTNAQARLEVPGMDEIVNARAEMAFTILSTLVGIKAKCDDIMKGLLLHAWSLVRASPVDYDVATAPEDLGYYRTLLQVLYLAIQPHVYLPMKERRGASATDETTLVVLDPAIAGCLVEIVGRVIAPGFRALCGNLHTSVEMALPADFALLIAILRALLSVRGVEAVFSQIADIVASSSLVRGALSLYSWSDRLAEAMEEDGKQDPVYGEVSVLFLVALSTVPAVAEHMALTGILTQLASANLSNYFRKAGGKGPFEFPQRAFAIWSEGLLPLCLNLLDAVGPPIAPDVSTFLNSFSHQLRRAETSLENRAPSPRHPHAGAVTLGLVSEAHSLCLISRIVSISIARAADEGLDANDVPKLDFDAQKVKEDAVGLVRQKISLASRVVAVGEREEEWKKADGGSGSDDVLMAKIVAEISNLETWFGDATAG